MITQSALLPKKKQKEVIFDRDTLTAEYQQALFSGLALVGEKVCARLKNPEANRKLRVLNLGTGTGVLTMFVRQHFAACLEKITCVELDAGVLSAAKTHFGFNAEEDELIESVNGDAYDFVLSAPSNTYDLVLQDLGSDSDEICPAPQFLEATFLTKLVDILRDDGGLACLNTIVDGNNERKVTQEIKQVAGCVKFASKMEEEKNKVVYLAKGAFDRAAQD